MTKVVKNEIAADFEESRRDAASRPIDKQPL